MSSGGRTGSDENADHEDHAPRNYSGVRFLGGDVMDNFVVIYKILKALEASMDFEEFDCHPDNEGFPGGSFSISPGDDLFDMFSQKTKANYVIDSKHLYRMRVDWSKIKDEDELYEMIKSAREHFESSHNILYVYEDEKHEICKTLSEIYPQMSARRYNKCNGADGRVPYEPAQTDRK